MGLSWSGLVARHALVENGLTAAAATAVAVAAVAPCAKVNAHGTAIKLRLDDTQLVIRNSPCMHVCIKLKYCVQKQFIGILCLLFHDTAITCNAPLTEPANGKINITCNTVGCMASYSCNNQSVLIGNSTTVCLSNGLWSGSSPVCQGRMCASILI